MLIKGTTKSDKYLQTIEAISDLMKYSKLMEGSHYAS